MTSDEFDAVAANALLAFPIRHHSQEPVVLRSCSICNWTNVSLINLGEPNKPRMVCQGCCKRAVDTMDEILALTQNPTLHRGGISLNETGGKADE